LFGGYGTFKLEDLELFRSFYKIFEEKNWGFENNGENKSNNESRNKIIFVYFQ